MSPLRTFFSRLFLLEMATLFTISGGLLWNFGINYDGLSGAMASKIHPATYGAVLIVIGIVSLTHNPVVTLFGLLRRELGSLTLLVATFLVLIFAITTQRPGIAGLIDTFCLPALLVIILDETPRPIIERAEAWLHLILAGNAIMTIYEFANGLDLIPYRFEGVLLYNPRPSGLQGQAVNNGVVIGTYLMILLAGAGRRLPRELRLPMIVLQAAALVACGERTAAILGAMALSVRGGLAVMRALIGARTGQYRAAMFASVVPLALVAAALLVSNGALSHFVQRFESDGGSAMARIEMFKIFANLPLYEIVIGPNVDVVDTLRYSHGLALGIENPVVRFVLYQGMAATLLLCIGVAYLFYDLGKKVGSGYRWPFLYFFTAIMSYESLGSKTTVLAKFVVLVIVGFNRKSTVSTDRMRLGEST